MDSVSSIRSSHASPALQRSPSSSLERGRVRSPITFSALATSRAYSPSRSRSPVSSVLILTSDLASSERFDTWRRGTTLTMPLSVGGSVRWDAFPVPQIVKDIGNYLLDIGLPEWLGTENKTSHSRICQPQTGGVQNAFLSSEDDLALRNVYQRIEDEAAELTRLHSQQMKGDLNWRIPVDNIIRAAFVGSRTQADVRASVECDFICDLTIMMPHSDAALNIERIMTADSVISTAMYPSPSMFSLDSAFFEELRVDREPGQVSPVVCVPHLFVQYCGDNGTLEIATNKLYFCFGAAMQQRRLLGHGEVPVFGVACCTGRVRMLCSYWKDDQIQIVRLYADDFDLQMTEQACIFFMLLLRIRCYLLTFAKELEIVDGDAVQERIRNSKRSWKAEPTHPPPPGTSWKTPQSRRSSSRSRSSSPKRVRSISISPVRHHSSSGSSRKSVKRGSSDSDSDSDMDLDEDAGNEDADSIHSVSSTLSELRISSSP